MRRWVDGRPVQHQPQRRLGSRAASRVATWQPKVGHKQRQCGLHPSASRRPAATRSRALLADGLRVLPASRALRAERPAAIRSVAETGRPTYQRFVVSPSLRRSGHHPAGRKRPPPAALRAPRRPVAARRGAVSPGGGPAPRARDRRLAGKAIGDVGGGTRTGVALHGLWPPGETMRARRRFLVKLMGLRKGSTLTLTPPRRPSPRLSPAMTELYPRCNGITGMRRRLAACRSDRTCLKRGGVASPAVRSA